MYIFPLVPNSKVPLLPTDWRTVATDNPLMRETWAAQYPGCNWAIACGPSRIVVLDFDTYKEGGTHPDSLLSKDEQRTHTVYTPRGGTHFYYDAPQDIDITNRRGSLPPGVDIRGSNGYVVAPPSIVNGGQYTSNLAITLLPLPQHIIDMVRREEAPATKVYIEYHTPEQDEVRRALAHIPTHPGYDTWLTILMAVHSVWPDEVGVILCEEWSAGHKGEIARKFASFKQGGIGIGTLFHIAQQHGYKPPPPSQMVADQTRQRLRKAQTWLNSGDCPPYIKEKAAKRVIVAPLISMLHVLVGYGLDRGTTRVYVTCRTLANTLATTGMSVHRQLTKLEEMGMLHIEETDKGTGTTVDISPLLNVTDILPDGVIECNDESQSFHQRHIGDDAFATYPYSYAAKRRGAPLLPSLGPTGLLLWGHLVKGGTVATLAEAVGMSRPTIKKALEKFTALNLVERDVVGNERWYQLIQGAESRLDEVRKEMQTAWVGQMRVARNHSATADYAALRLRQLRRSPSVSARDLAWWENLRRDSDGRAQVIFDFLESVGYDARRKVGSEKAVRRQPQRFDYREEWLTWGRPLFDKYRELGDIDHHEKVRMLAISRTSAETEADTWYAVHKEVREKVDMMLMMANNRLRYERTTPVEEEATGVVEGQLAFTFA